MEVVYKFVFNVEIWNFFVSQDHKVKVKFKTRGHSTNMHIHEN